MVFMVAPPLKKNDSEVDVEAELRRLLADMPLKSAVKTVVETFSLNKNEVYQTALRIKNES